MLIIGAGEAIEVRPSGPVRQREVSLGHLHRDHRDLAGGLQHPAQQQFDHDLVQDQAHGEDHQASPDDWIRQQAGVGRRTDGDQDAGRDRGKRGGAGGADQVQVDDEAVAGGHGDGLEVQDGGPGQAAGQRRQRRQIGLIPVPVAVTPLRQ